MQFNLPYTYWKEQGIGYSPKAERLIFTVGSCHDSAGKSSLAFSIGRYVGESLCYPDGKRIAKWRTYGDPHKHCEVIGEGDSIVLVEDLISAHKVAYAKRTSIPLFGTTVHRPVLYYLLNDPRRVVLWLDKDQTLNVKAKSLELASVIGRHVEVVVTDKDPKWLTEKEINEAIK